MKSTSDNAKSMDLREEPHNLVFPAAAFLELFKRASKGIEFDLRVTHLHV